MLLDEFKRIAAICRTLTVRSKDAMYAVEILGLCERAAQKIPQRVPVIAQRDEALAANKEMGDAIERLAEAMKFKGNARAVCGMAIERHRDCGTFQKRLEKALVTIDELNQAAIDAEV